MISDFAICCVFWPSPAVSFIPQLLLERDLENQKFETFTVSGDSYTNLGGRGLMIYLSYT